MNRIVISTFALLSVLRLSAADNTTTNSLTDAEKAAGWKLLFNGKDFNGWHNFKAEGVRPGWQVKDGALVCVDPKALTPDFTGRDPKSFRPASCGMPKKRRALNY